MSARSSSPTCLDTTPPVTMFDPRAPSVPLLQIRPTSKRYICLFIAIGAFRYTRNCIASAVKIVIGRRAYFTPHDILFRQYAAHVLGLKKLREITCVHSQDEGAGSQALTVMDAIRFARALGLTYVHTPFRRIHHADRPADEWAAAWETHFNLGEGEVRGGRSALNYAQIGQELEGLFLELTKMRQPFDEELRREFRRKYYLNKTPRINPVFALCVHVRRRNRHDFNDKDATDISRLGPVVDRLRALLAARQVPYTLRVFSQGPARDFDRLGLGKDELFLDADAIWTMSELIEADLLVTTKGSYSHVAGLLCDGMVLADPQYPLQPDWESYSEAGNFDAASLERRLPSAPSGRPSAASPER
jgi:hypothetical protein